MITLDGRIDVNHHVATENNPLCELPGPRIWWSEDEAFKMMDNNDPWSYGTDADRNAPGRTSHEPCCRRACSTPP